MRKTNAIHSLWTILAVIVVLGLLAYSILGDNKSRDIIGTWVIDTGTSESGFECGRHGMAATIRNSTTQYSNWEISHHQLILKGKRFKDRHIYDISDTLAIKQLNSKNLTVLFDGEEHQYRKIR